MSAELKAQLEEINKNLLDKTEEIKKSGIAVDERIKALETLVAAQTKQIQEQSQRRAVMGVAGNDAASREKTLGMTLAAAHANRIAVSTFGKKSIADLTDSQARDIGWTGETRELGSFMAEKAAQWSSDTSGGVFVSHTVASDEWIPLLVPKIAYLQAGVKVVDLPAGAGSITIPRQTSDPTVSNLSENGKVPTSDAAWEMLTLVPHRTAGGGFISNRLIYSYSAYLNILTERLQYVLQRNVQKQLFYGKGAEGQTKGLAYDPGVNKHYLSTADGTVTGHTGKIMAPDDISIIEEVLELQNAPTDGVSLFMRPEVKRGMKHFRFQQYSGDTTGMPIFSMSPAQTLLSNAMLRDLLDHDYYMLTDLIKGKSAASGGATDLSDLFAINGEDIRIFTWGGTKVKFSDTAVLNGVSAFEQNFVAELIDLDFDVLIGNGKKHVWVPDVRTNKQALS